jgi:alanyl-tRNA synthetase
MTDRLYYLDPYLREFDAAIERVEARGDRFVITLDRTAFYPSSGGQPFDTGILGRWHVVDVVDEEDGSIAHVVEPRTLDTDPGDPPDPRDPRHPPAPPEPGSVLRGAVDWPRRFDHMQQHTGQHLLSAALDRLFGVRTVSFHMGAAVSTIDLAREVSPAEIAAAETDANRIVWEGRPVGIRFATAEEAAAMPLRKEAVRGGTLRLIDVEGYDLSACGGTHVARTGGIGIIAVASWERFKGGLRLSFLCGGRALGGYRALRDAVSGAVRLLSVLPDELPASIERMQAEAKEQKKAMVRLQADLARHRAEELAAAAEPIQLSAGVPDAVKLVARVIDGDATALKALATSIVASPGYVVVLVSAVAPALAVVARSSDVSVPAERLLASLITKFGGRGGGKADFAQGGGLAGSPEHVLGAARALLRAHQLPS